MNNQGIIRLLKKIDKKLKEKKANNNEKNRIPFVAFLALIISVLSLYFQFFHYHNLSASFVSGGIVNDSIHYDIIFHNKGNQDATIINTDIWYYSDNNKEKPKNHFGFKNKSYDPFILTSGNQKFFKINEQIDFGIFDFEKNNTNSTDTLRIELQFRFLNDQNLLSDKEVSIGWITLDENRKIEYFSLNFESIDLQADSYISKTYKNK